MRAADRARTVWQVTRHDLPTSSIPTDLILLAVQGFPGDFAETGRAETDCVLLVHFGIAARVRNGRMEPVHALK